MATRKTAGPWSDHSQLSEALLSELAAVRGANLDELRAEFRASGDIGIDSREAMTIVGALEGSLTGQRLAGPEDLEPEQVTSIASLRDVVWSHLEDRPVARRSGGDVGRSD